MKMVNAIDTGAKPHPATLLMAPKIKINITKQVITMWPATILANKRTINANGLVKIPKNSTGTKIGFTKPGTGGLKICAQKCLLVLNKITKKLITPKTIVNAIFPVTLAEPGINPIKLLIKMKKNTVSK